MLDLALALVAYLFGSISTAIVTCKLMGLPDPRTVGSGNPGATNVLRLGGKKAALITLVGDSVKAVIPVLIGKAFGLEELSLGILAVAAFLGHLFPVFFRFQGGKGVATAAGAILALDWVLGLGLLGVWLGMALVFRYSSLAALTASIASPILAWFLHPAYAWACLAMSIALVWRHKSNIQKLLAGEEDKIGAKKEKKEA
ncbi:MAG: glycerol-3-phosphate 1-O-acyltransferase PlsY [Gammaproteobacteria bacterium]|nr:glycerol-3-phosphate 1-O-acyltransferase PlsY [Gammaproteobacteria bacterium]